jgi:hypothetical protein
MSEISSSVYVSFAILLTIAHHVLRKQGNLGAADHAVDQHYRKPSRQAPGPRDVRHPSRHHGISTFLLLPI